MRDHEPPGTRLEGWKAIARYLGKDPRTALRWVDLGLPVRRVNGRNSSVYAYSDEVEAWLRNRPADLDDGARPPAQGPARDARQAQGPSTLAELWIQASELWRLAGAALPLDGDQESQRLLREAVLRATDPGADPEALARALKVACRSFLDAVRTGSGPRRVAGAALAPLARLGSAPARVEAVRSATG